MAKKKQKGPEPWQERRDTKLALRELQVLRGCVSSIQSRGAKICAVAGELRVHSRRLNEDVALGDALFELIYLCQAIQADLLDITNQIRTGEGMKEVGPSQTYLEIERYLKKLVDQLKEELEVGGRRSGGTFAPSHASVRRDERPPSTTRRSASDEI